MAEGPVATDEIIRRMYESPPDGFVAARAAAVAAARKSGDREAAQRLAALRKPTVAAWLVNLLALRRPELIADLVQLSAALRTAQRGLQGEQLRELTAQRRKVVSALVDEARRLAVAEDPGAGGKLPLGEVEATLSAALADPEVAAQVRTGRLIRAAAYAGFGEVPRPRLRLVTDENAERQRQLRRELDAAQAAEDRADAQLAEAEAAERAAGQAVEDIDAELAALERRRTDAQAEVGRTKQLRRTAERDAAAARRRVGDVQAAIEDLDSGDEER